MRLQDRPRKRQVSQREHEGSRNGVCELCPAGCGLTLFSRGDVPVDIMGMECHPINKGALCPRAVALPALLRGTDRLPLPAIRERNTDPWRPVEWDTALDFLAEGMRAAGMEHCAIVGPEDAPLDYAAGADWLAQAAGIPLRPAHFHPQAFGAEGCVQRMAGLAAGQLLSNTPRDWCASRAILMVSGDLAADQPVTFGRLLDARDRGSKLLYLGSCAGIAARRATRAWVVRPGTEDMALAAVLHALLRDGATHTAFLEEHTCGFDALRQKLQAFSPAEVAGPCGLLAKDLEELAAILAHTEPLQVLTGAVNRRRWISDATLGLCLALAAVRGSLGRPGGGCNILGSTPFAATQAASGLTLEESLRQGKVKALLGWGDTMGRLAGSAAREAATRLPLLAHFGCHDNATRQHAHVSLPVAHGLEYAHLVARNDGRSLQWSPMLLAPSGFSLAPLEVWARLVQRLAPAAPAPWADGRDPVSQESLAEWLLRSHPLTEGLHLDALQSDAEDEGGALWPCPAGAEDASTGVEHTRYIRGTVRGKNNILFTPYSVWPGGVGMFPTQDGKLHLEEATMPAPVGAQLPPDALALLVAGEADALDGPRGLFWGQDDACVARINAATAARHGLARRSRVRVRSAFGEVQAVVAITPDVPDNALALPQTAALALLESAPVLGTVALELELQC